ncbi:MAG: RibD family protein [Prochlorothrix sp.]
MAASEPERPPTTLVLALSIDGKIADRDKAPARFGSAEDKRRLEQAIAAADAVLLGAGTVRAYRSSLSITDPALLAQRSAQHRPPQPIQILCSPSGHLDPTWRFFAQPFPRWLLTTPIGAIPWQHPTSPPLPPAAPALAAPAAATSAPFDRTLPLLTGPPNTWNWPAILAQLGQVLSLALTTPTPALTVLGGGTLVAPLLEQGCIDELKLTLCPLLLGGVAAPSLLQGVGFPEAIAPRLELLSAEQVADELFLHYRVRSR